jgi:hypothetical protein
VYAAVSSRQRAVANPISLFLIPFLGQALTDWRAHILELHLHCLPEIGSIAYLMTGHFVSATFGN